MFDKIFAAEGKLGLKHGRDAILYRGQSSPNTLLPSIFRPPFNGNRELEIYSSFLRESYRFVESKDSWEVASLMQHHKAPMRLLDWSGSLHVALFFALAGSSADSPTVYVLDPLGLNKRSYGINHIPLTQVEFEVPYSDFIRGNDGVEDLPLVVATSKRLERVVAQDSYFTVHGKNRLPIEQQAPAHVVEVSFDKAEATVLRNLLFRLDINRYTIFPCLDNLGEATKTFFESVIEGS